MHDLRRAAAMDHDRTVRELEMLETLGQVLHWAQARSPRAEFVNVVIQDEYTHDIVIRVGDRIYAVFDAT
jgi:hypothetical protein